MADDLQFDPYRFIASQNKLNFAKDELESFMAKVTEAELFIMPKDMPCKILLNKHLKTLEKYPANLNDWDIKMTDFKNMISTLDATFAEQLGVDSSAQSVTDELANIESELVTLNEKYDEYMSKLTQYASRREAYPASEEDRIMLSRKRELEARQAEINGTLHIEEDKWYEDIANAGKTLFKSAEDVVDSVLKGDKDSIIENSIDLGVQLKATEAVVDTSVVSGVGKIVEGILDGVGVVLTGVASIPTGIYDGATYLLSKVSNFEFESSTKKMWEQTMDDVARDKVGEINDSFYTDTILGQTINDNSALKYDGAGAGAIQTGAKFVGEVALFTVSGGTLAPVLGGLEALGESAQNEYQKEDRRIFTPRMAVETAGGVFKGIMYNRIGTNILKLGQLGVKQGVATVVDNAKASVAKAGFKGILKHAFWSKDALQDVVFTTLQKGAEVYIGYDESDSKTWEEYKNSGELNWGNVILSTVTEILSGRFSDTLLGLASKADWTNDQLIVDYKKDVKTVKEILRKMDPRLVALYEEAILTGKEYEFFKGFEEHNFLHVKRVADESVKVSSVLNELIGAGKLDKNFFGVIDEEVIKIAGLAHDLGMSKGGHILVDGKLVKISEIMANLDYYEPYIRDTFKLKNGVSLSTLGDIEGKLIRKAHPLNSSIIVLQNRDIFGDDAELIACLDLLHSKSTSGVKNVVSEDELQRMAKLLFANQKTNGKTLYSFDISKLGSVDVDGNVTLFPEVLKKLRTGAIALRVGDSHALKTGFNHEGAEIVIGDMADVNKFLESYIVDDSIPKTKWDELLTMESTAAQVKVYNGKTSDVLTDGADDSVSKQINLGERNTYALGVYSDNGTVVYTHVVNTADNPACTFKWGLIEKFEEYLTFKSIDQKVVIQLPADTPDAIFDFYNTAAASYYKKNGLPVVVKKAG